MRIARRSNMLRCACLQAEVVPGVPVFRVDGELHFGNIRGVVETLEERLNDAIAAKAPLPATSTRTPRATRKPSNDTSVLPPGPMCDSDSRNVFAVAHERLHADATGLDAAEHGVFVAVDSVVAANTPLRGVVLDCSRVVSIDGSACQELAEVMSRFNVARVPLVCAALPGPTRDTMIRYGLSGVPTKPVPGETGNAQLVTTLSISSGMRHILSSTSEHTAHTSMNGEGASAEGGSASEEAHGTVASAEAASAPVAPAAASSVPPV